MKFGFDTFVTDQGMAPGQLAAEVEQRGFDVLLLTEHSHIPVKRETPWSGGGPLPAVYYRTFDPFVALATAAAATTTLRLGTAIALVPQRDVFYLAKQVATLDHVCNGRFVFGVGAGWNREEMRNHGIDAKDRGRLLNEKLAALRHIWTHDEAEFHGKFVDFDPIYSWPKPVQQPHPPIYVGGESPAALDRLVRFGDGWLPRARTPLEELRRVSAWLAEQGRPDIGVTVAGVRPDPATLSGIAGTGVVERVTFTLPTAGTSETLRTLDSVAECIAPFRSA